MSDYLTPAFAVILPNIGGFSFAVLASKNMEWHENQFIFHVFGPLWTALYSFMGYASYMAWRDGGGFRGNAAMPLVWYGTQLAFNWSWTPICCGMRDPKWTLAHSLCILGATAGTMYNFYHINKIAAALMVPNLVWESGVIAFIGYVLVDSYKKEKERKKDEKKE